jgi:hypothetical protein
MSNLVKVVAQIRKQRDEAQRQVEQLDQALAALGSLDGLRDAGQRSPGANHVSRCAEKECRGTACALGKMEGRSEKGSSLSTHSYAVLICG